MLNGLDLFSGIGGISLALSPWVRTIAYCEQNRYAQSVLLQRMHEGDLHRAPIWDDVQTLTREMLPPIDIIFGGFPCQDISVAGNGIGLEGKRSGLFFEIMRLAEEIKPTFIFLENVPAIRTRGLERVVRELTDRGYDSRWCALSAQEVGANHKRNRWFLLAYATRERLLRGGFGERSETNIIEINLHSPLGSEAVADIERDGRCAESASWWSAEPNVGRVVNGVPFRVDRIRCLGNAVVPLQAREAFMQLMGLNQEYVEIAKRMGET
jgi:DNA (cytosine-5)-methyltransferase 1